MDTLRGEGYGTDQLEFWTLGWPGTGADVPVSFTGSSAYPCVEVTGDMLFDPVLSWDKDDLWLIDRAGYATFWGNLQTLPLWDGANLAALDAAIRALL